MTNTNDKRIYLGIESGLSNRFPDIKLLIELSLRLSFRCYLELISMQSTRRFLENGFISDKKLPLSISLSYHILNGRIYFHVHLWKEKN